MTRTGTRVATGSHYRRRPEPRTRRISADASITWFAFCVAAAAAILGGIAVFLRLGDWVFRRARGGGRSG